MLYIKTIMTIEYMFNVFLHPVNWNKQLTAGPLHNFLARRLLICISGALKAIMAVSFIFVHKHNFISAEKNH